MLAGEEELAGRECLVGVLTVAEYAEPPADATLTERAIALSDGLVSPSEEEIVVLLVCNFEFLRRDVKLGEQVGGRR